MPIFITHVFTSCRQCFNIWFCARKTIRPVSTEWWDAGLVICLEWDANDIHVPLPPYRLLLH